MNNHLRPPAVPLVTVDPYFNVWSKNDHLFDDTTIHWTYEKDRGTGTYGMVGLVKIDGEIWRFMGQADQGDEEPKHLQQTDLSVKPLTTTYEFQGGGIALQVEFMTPLLLDDLEILSRPASYIHFDVWTTDGNQHDIEIYFDVTGELCVHEKSQEVQWSHEKLENDIDNLKMGTVSQPILMRKGDDTRIDWGYLHLVVPQASYAQSIIGGKTIRQQWIQKGTLPDHDDTDMPRAVSENAPVMATCLHVGKVAEEKKSRLIVLAYDDILSIEYFHQQLPAYWRRNGQTVEDMLQAAVREYPELRKVCHEINEEVIGKASQAGGPNYKDITALAYRQAIAAHKLVVDEDGELLFLSKENNSNGCIGTVDVSYPSIPLFLLYNPELVKGMMRPIFRYARSEDWKFDFAPHDVGCYPIANGQVYGEKLENQMPIEECGNMLIMMTAVCLADGKSDFAKENWDLLTKWAAYLMEYGLDPGDQLCTDDFAGHLAHNANLSIKAIVGIGGYSILCRMLNKTEEADRYLELAKELASKWEEMAKEDDHYKLAFNQPNTWSLKYNLVWDELFSLHLFDQKIREVETDYYLSKLNRYGTPLDSRETYTKADWLLWAATLTDDKDKRNAIIESLWNFLNESESRVPFTDWYDTKSAKRLNFKNRSVVGGMFMLLMKETNWINYEIE